MAYPEPGQINEVITGFDRLYGLRILECSPEIVRAEVAIRDDLRQPAGLLHGGVVATIAESMASMATAFAVAPEGMVAVGLQNSTSFLRPLLEGTVHAVAERLHRGRTTWLWDVSFRDDRRRLCALTRMTIAVRSMAPSRPA